jgi:hypothetical protein
VRGDQYWGPQKATLKVIEGGLPFCYLGEFVCLPEKLIEEEGFFA